eukprot:jgi/Picre1/28030/NNA_000991.t1
MTDKFNHILKHFPTIDHAFAYGSGVFGQPGLYDRVKKKAGKQPMIDFVFAVRDPVRWHQENIECNSMHYSFVSACGPTAVQWATDTIGSGIYYNTLVPVGSSVIKYGVVSVDTLKRDLRDWDTMYLAGRLQKPVNTLISNDGIVSAQKLNIDSAMKTALLLCPNTFNVTELLKIICSLSYIGDIRLGFAEDSKKVERIVRGSHDRMFEMYTNGMEKALEASMITLLGPSQSLVNARSVFRNTLSVSDRTLLYASLPINVLRNIVKLKRGDKLPKSAKLLTTSEQADMTHRLDLGKYLASSPYGALHYSEPWRRL